ncbi:MAG: gamma-glutamyl-gamma-aminobutyrate hydrolase family protein [Planctomycetaceae bacterium]|nr:gamma-glutamyl-gamma-aminobutyrate hydrolase family protein [Planctomycetaceae bacterium]
MKRPLIGINCKIITDGEDSYYKLDRNYVRSVENAGGTPVLMPAFRTAAEVRSFLARLDGILFTGGPDINPCRWKARKHPKADLMHEDREKSDFMALKETLARDLPALCICCGHQELNVALGGSLHQHVYDLPDVDKHSEGATHPVRVFGGNRLREIVGKDRPTVNSWHHQAIDKLGRGLRITAVAEDGIIEGVESDAHRFLVGVQWHPERMQDDRRQQNLFRALISEACR